MVKKKIIDGGSSKNAKLNALEVRIDELTNALRQERADAMNLRRRHDEQMSSVRSLVKASIITELLPVIDNFERAMKHVPAELASNDFLKGIQQIAKQFDKALEDLGVTKIDTVGYEFDPTIHEAVVVEEGKGHKDIISEEVLAGYRLGDEVIRHALVKVRPQ